MKYVEYVEYVEYVLYVEYVIFVILLVALAKVTPVWLSGRASVVLTEGPRFNPGRRQAFSNLLLLLHLILYSSVHRHHARTSDSCCFCFASTSVRWRTLALNTQLTRHFNYHWMLTCYTNESNVIFSTQTTDPDTMYPRSRGLSRLTKRSQK